jgi:hypothetical protein
MAGEHFGRNSLPALDYCENGAGIANMGRLRKVRRNLQVADGGNSVRLVASLYDFGIPAVCRRSNAVKAASRSAFRRAFVAGSANENSIEWRTMPLSVR